MQLCLVVLVASQLQAQTRCEKQKLPSSLQWVSSMEVLKDGSQVALADPVTGSLWRFNFEGHKMEHLPMDRRIRSITGLDGDGLFAECTDTEAILLSSEFEVQKPVGLRNRGLAEPTGLGSIYTGWAAHDSYFIGAGTRRNSGLDLTNPELPYAVRHGFQTGFLTGRIDTNTGTITEVDLLANVQMVYPNYFLLGYRYFTGNDKGLFFVDMQPPKASLYSLRPGEKMATQLELPLPESLIGVQPIQEDRSAHPAARALNAIESESMIAGLYSASNHLLVVTREPDVGTSTKWLVYPINLADPETSIEPLRLPTNAPQLSLAVSDRFLYGLERSSVDASGDQEIGPLFRVPTTWLLDSQDSPLNASSPKVLACK
jgi:hypothetical protein